MDDFGWRNDKTVIYEKKFHFQGMVSTRNIYKIDVFINTSLTYQ